MPYYYDIDINALSLPEIILWLLVYAVVYGILTHVGIPKTNSSRAIIGIAVSTLVLLYKPYELISVLSKISSSMLVVLIGLLLLLVFTEMLGLKFGGQEGKKFYEHETMAKVLFIILALVGIAIFINSGGLELLGFETTIGTINWNTVIFLLIVVLAIWWMASEKTS
jgi:hypothetical protein